MSILDSFELIDTVSCIPNITITKNGISFNKGTLEKLGCPEYVQVLIDKVDKRIAIIPCEKADRGSRTFFKDGRSVSNGVRWNNFDLRTTLESMMGWSLEDCGWRASGKYSEEDNALIYDLTSVYPVKRS